MKKQEVFNLKHAGSWPIVAVEFNPKSASANQLALMYPGIQEGEFFPAVEENWSTLTPLELPHNMGAECWAHDTIRLYKSDYKWVKE